MRVVQAPPLQRERRDRQEEVRTQFSAADSLIDESRGDGKRSRAPHRAGIGQDHEIDIAVRPDVAGRERAGNSHHPHMRKIGQVARIAQRQRPEALDHALTLGPQGKQLSPIAQRVEPSIRAMMGRKRCLPHRARNIRAFAAHPMEVAVDFIERGREIEHIPVGDRRIDRTLELVQLRSRIVRMHGPLQTRWRTRRLP